MKMLIKYSFLLLVVGCLRNNRSINIIPLSPFQVETNRLNEFNKKTDKNKIKYFLIENYALSNSNELLIIDSFARSNFVDNDSSFSFYTIYFYKASSKTKKDFVENSNDKIDWHQDDLVFQYLWIDGRFIKRFDYLEGKIINGNPSLRIEDISK